MKKILIVDDSQEVNYFIKAALESDGFKINTATTGHEAFSLIKASAPDLIILDVVLPLLDGYEICRMLKIDDTTRNIPIILMSGKNLDMVSVEKALQIWVNRFLHKPIDMIELKRVVYELLAEDVTDVLKRIQIVDSRFGEVINSYKKIVRIMDGMFARFAKNEKIDYEELKSAVLELTEVFIGNKEILYNLMNSYVIDSPSALHSVNTSLIAMCIGQVYDLSKSSLTALSAITLTHEFSEKFELILSKLGFTEIEAKEKAQFQNIIKVADKYENLTSIRAGQMPLPPMVAIKRIAEDKSLEFDQVIIKHMLTCISPYPLGSFVKLNTGEIAKVKGLNLENPFRPLIEIIMDRFGNVMLEPKEVDLTQELQVFIFRNVFRDEVYNAVMKFAKDNR
ncbi:MAG: response regulator [Candidatus Brocadiia bacterium]